AELEQQALGLLLGLVLLRCRRLDRGGQLARLGQQLLLLVTRGLGDELAERLLLGAQLVEADAGGPASLVGQQQHVDTADVLATGALGRTDTVGVLTEQAKVNHISRLPVPASRPRTDIPLCRHGAPYCRAPSPNCRNAKSGIIRPAPTRSCPGGAR